MDTETGNIQQWTWEFDGLTPHRSSVDTETDGTVTATAPDMDAAREALVHTMNRWLRKGGEPVINIDELNLDEFLKLQKERENI